MFSVTLPGGRTNKPGKGRQDRQCEGLAVLAVLVVIIVIPAVALFVRGGGDQPVQIILPTPGGTDGKTASPGVGSSKESPGKPELRVYVSGEVQSRESTC